MIKTLDELNCSTMVFGTMRLGTWGANMNAQDLLAMLELCLDLGMTTIDLADIYGDYTTETDIGHALKLQPSLREKLQLITKCGILEVCDTRPNHRIKSYDAGREHILMSVDNTLKALQTDYVDILLIHRPDWLLDPAEVATVFQELHSAGKVRAFGVSNFTPSQFDLLHASVPLVTNQVEVSLLKRDCFNDGTLDQSLRLGLRPMAWSPFGGGTIFNPEDDTNRRIHKVVNEIAETHNATLDQILLAWLLRHPARIMPVIGTTKAERVKSAAAAEKIQLSRVEWYDLWQAATGGIIA